MDYVEKTPVRLRVASIVRDAILSGEFPAGRLLSLTETAELLRVSRTPVREAFQLLQSEGLLELRMNRGALVKPVNTKFITDHFDMRGLLEGEAIYRAISNGMDSAILQEAQDKATARSAISEEEYDEYNQRFHQAIWHASGNDKLFSMLDSLWNGPSYSHTKGREVDHGKSIAEHDVIVECVRQRDANRGRDVMREHIVRSMNIILGNRGQIAVPEHAE